MKRGTSWKYAICVLYLFCTWIPAHAVESSDSAKKVISAKKLPPPKGSDEGINPESPAQAVSSSSNDSSTLSATIPVSELQLDNPIQFEQISGRNGTEPLQDAAPNEISILFNATGMTSKSSSESEEDDRAEMCKKWRSSEISGLTACVQDCLTYSEVACQQLHSMKHSQAQNLDFLETMLVGYDKRSWPTYGTEVPTDVSVNININTLGPVNAAHMEYGMDIYLRQSWTDPRLALSKYRLHKDVTLNAEDIAPRIWKPDIFFRNVKEASFHTVTVPNKLIRLSPDGRVLYSMRITMKLACRMSFMNYPLDIQKCHVILGAYAQTTEQVVIRWRDVNPVHSEEPLELPEFTLTKLSYSNFTRDIDTGSFSFLNVTFVLVRENGYHLIQTYMPTFLIVMISWVSFWLNVDATAARVTLGVTTLLTLTTVAYGVRMQLPPVSYVKAIDIWIGACSVMVFGALLEFTLVNYLSRSKLGPDQLKHSINIFHWSRKVNLEQDHEENNKGASQMESNIKKARYVDRFCRVIFPSTFTVFNFAYWLYYLLLTRLYDD